MQGKAADRSGTGGGMTAHPPTHVQHATNDRDEAERVVTDLYLPNQLELAPDDQALDMTVTGLRVGAVTVGRLTYGRQARLRTADAQDFHVNIPLRGSALSRSGTGEPVGVSASSPRFGDGRAATRTPASLHRPPPGRR
ncbi:hypothetical protein GCM10027596_36670 [Nocardioides korecus]